MISLPRPLRLALLDKGAHAGAEVVAGVACADEIVCVGQACLHDAADRLLAHTHGDWRMVREPTSELGDALVELVRCYDLAHKSARQRFLSRKILGKQQHAFRSWCP